MTAKEWLGSERDYEAGRQLYAALGDNDRLKRMLGTGPSHYNREALAWELTKLARAGVVAPVRREPGFDDYGNRIAPAHFFMPLAEQEAYLKSRDNATETLQNVVSSPENVVSSPAEGGKLDDAAGVLLDELRDARRPLYDERSGLHMQLEGLATEEARRLMCVRILALSRALDENWAADRYVRAHGQLPPAPAPAPGLDTLSPAELLKRRNNLRSQASKLKNKPARANDLAQVQTDLALVEALLTHE